VRSCCIHGRPPGPGGREPQVITPRGRWSPVARAAGDTGPWSTRRRRPRMGSWLPVREGFDHDRHDPGGGDARPVPRAAAAPGPSPQRPRRDVGPGGQRPPPHAVQAHCLADAIEQDQRRPGGERRGEDSRGRRSTCSSSWSRVSTALSTSSATPSWWSTTTSAAEAVVDVQLKPQAPREPRGSTGRRRPRWPTPAGCLSPRCRRPSARGPRAPSRRCGRALRRRGGPPRRRR